MEEKRPGEVEHEDWLTENEQEDGWHPGEQARPQELLLGPGWDTRLERVPRSRKRPPPLARVLGVPLKRGRTARKKPAARVPAAEVQEPVQEPEEGEEEVLENDPVAPGEPSAAALEAGQPPRRSSRLLARAAAARAVD